MDPGIPLGRERGRELKHLVPQKKLIQPKMYDQPWPLQDS